MFRPPYDAALEADIVTWFRANLPVAGCGLPPAVK
jgi:hypothetical protein